MPKVYLMDEFQRKEILSVLEDAESHTRQGKHEFALYNIIAAITKLLDVLPTEYEGGPDG